MAVNYVNRIRGGIERLQIYPNLGINIAAEGQITKLNGGIVEVNSGALAGAKIVINADPNPKKPISYTWDNRWRPESDRNPNTGPDAVRAINEYDQISDYLDSSKDDLIIVIGTQEKASPTEKMPIHPNAISKTVFFGPHRSIFNVPALITIPYDQEKLKNSANIKPLVFNEITQSFEIHPKVRSNYNNQLDTANGTFTFETQILGQFVLAEISD
jgi:hypothetical protein